MFFHTNDDDKDFDTDLMNEIQQLDNTGSWMDKAFADGWYWKFKDGSTNGPISLFVYGPAPKNSSIPGSCYQITINPNGKDTWSFDYDLYLTFEDGSQCHYNENDVILSEASTINRATLI